MSTINEKELKILEFWKKDKTFKKSLKKTEGKKEYIFYDGPPFATGLPHYGHLLASILKDAFPRYHTMQGKHVNRVWGWDCHGLPIESIAERELKIKSKDEIEKMGVKKFNDFCRSCVLKYTGEWEHVIDRIARWVDFKGGYKTMDKSYIESVWWAFKQLHEKGYIYEGEKILMYCPRCSTPLSKSEIAMDNSYKKVKDKAITIKFKLKGENVYALAWTTTPWTLPSNLALTVNKKIEYAYVKDKSDGTTYLLAKDLIEKYFRNKEEYSIEKIVKGSELAGEEYEPLFPYFSKLKNAFKFLVADFVTAKDGTGIVHTAPAFGEDDYAVCKENEIEFVQPVDAQGKFTKEVKDFAGQYIFDTNDKIIDFLRAQNKIVKTEKFEHEYPFCYRCETPLMYRAIPAWFVNIQKIKKKMLSLNKKINWYPEFLKDGRVSHTIQTAPDWNMSRNRYWATAIPIWKNKKGDIMVIGSIEELKKYAVKFPKGEIDLHKDYLDQVQLKGEDGTIYTRIPEVLDCWFESGAMPFAQFHYPFENKEFFEKHFPAQFVVEYIGQVRAWFYYMIALSAILFDKIPFENVLTTGTILAEDGSKMSKSKNNFVDPMIISEKFGVDALRFYLLASPLMNADNFNFSEKGVEEIYKKVILLLNNTLNFYEPYKEGKIEEPKSKNIIDKWIIARLNQLINNYTKYFEEYNTIKSCNEIREFVDDLSTWYIRRTRDRFNSGDKDAIKTLGFVLENLSKVCAPVMPFISEEIYQNLHGEKESVHLQDFPKANMKKVNSELIESMKLTREVVSLALKERDRAQLPIKQPLAKVDIFGTKISEDYFELIMEELNVKEIQLNKGKEISIKLDTNLTPELEAEGFAREISRKVQAFRKELGLDKSDKIELFINSKVIPTLTPPPKSCLP